MLQGTVVELINEDGKPTYWFVLYPITNEIGAKREAWRAYRDLDRNDGAFPPKWTKARVLGKGCVVQGGHY